MPVLHLTVCQTPTRSLKCECKTQKNMHVFIHMETIGLLASYCTKCPTSHTKIPLWSGNYRSARLVPLSLPIFWLQMERDRQAKNPSIWLLTEKELKMCSDPSTLWFIKDVGCWGAILDSRAGRYGSANTQIRWKHSKRNMTIELEVI